MRLFELNFFRSVAVLLVFVAHFFVINMKMKTTGIGFLDQVILNGSVGVDIFFVLSGFLLPYTIYKAKESGKYSLIGYLKKRFQRIMPAYYFSLIILLLFTPVYFTSKMGLLNIGTHLVFIHNFWRDFHGGISGVAWTLGIEMQYYLLVPLIFSLFFKKVKHVLLLLILSFLIVWVYKYILYIYFYPDWDDWNKFIYGDQLLGRIDQFSIGTVAAFFYLKFFEKLKKIRGVSLFFNLMFFVFLAGYFMWVDYFSSHLPNLFSTMFSHSILGGIFGGMMFSSFFLIPFFQRFLKLKIFYYLASISYGFYLWHLVIMKKLVDIGLPISMQLLITIILTLMMALISYQFIEMPFMKRRAIKQSKK